MEWRPDKPKPAKKDTPMPIEERRAADRLLGERMVRVEQRLQGVEESLDRTDAAIIRLHERVDELTHKFGDFTDGVHSRVSEIINDVERSLDAHVREEEKLFSARFENILEKIDHVATDGTRRGEEALEGIKGLRAMGMAVIVGVGSVGLAFIGWLGNFIFDKGPSIIRVLDKLDALK